MTAPDRGAHTKSPLLRRGRPHIRLVPGAGGGSRPIADLRRRNPEGYIDTNVMALMGSIKLGFAGDLFERAVIAVGPAVIGAREALGVAVVNATQAVTAVAADV